MIRRYIYGWAMFARAVYMARTKKRGAGRQSWRHALKMGGCYRWLVDGQLRGGLGPRWIRKALAARWRAEIVYQHAECERLRQLAHDAPRNSESYAWADRSREWMAARAKLEAMRNAK